MSRWSGRLFKELREGASDRAAQALNLAGVFFLLTASAYIFKTVKISLFLKWLQASRLPFAYLITAVVMGFVVTLNAHLLRTMKRRPYILGSLAFFAGTLVLFRLLIPGHGKWLLILYWLWSDVFLAMCVTQFWIVVSDIFPSRQAKRLINPMVKAGLLGGVFGSFLASRLAGTLGTENLLVLGFVFIVAAMVLADPVLRLPPLLSPAEVHPERGATAAGLRTERVGYRKSFRALVRNRYLLLLSGAMLTAVTVSTLLDFQFNSVLEWKIVSADARTAFLGTFFTVLLIVSFLLQSVLMHRVLRVFGLRAAIQVTPVVLLIGVAASAVIPGAAALSWAVIVKGADKSLTHTFSQSTKEILYVPVPSATRAQAKVFIDMFLNKLGDGAAALLITAITALFAPSWKGMSIVTGIGLILWVVLNIGLHREYGGVVKGHLRVKRPDADSLVLERVDVDAAKLVFDTLESRDRSSVLYAMNLMDLVRRDRLSPELKAVLNAGASRARAGAFDGLLDAGGISLFPQWDDALEEEDLDAQVREILNLDVYQEVMKRRFDEWTERPRSDGVIAQMEAAKAIGMMPSGSPLAGHLRALLRNESPDVVRYALDSAARLVRREFVPYILPSLGNPLLQAAAAAALGAYGDRIAGFLGDILASPDEDPAVRKAVPGVLARAATPRAAAILVRALRRRDLAVRDEVVGALVRMRAENPNLRFPETDVGAEVRFSVGLCCDLLERAGRGSQTLTPGQEESVWSRALKGVFDLLSLIHPYDDIVRAWQNYTQGERQAVDYSIDLLEHLLRREDKDIVLPLLEDAPAEEKARRCREIRRRNLI